MIFQMPCHVVTWSLQLECHLVSIGIWKPFWVSYWCSILAWSHTTNTHPVPDIYRRKENALQGMLACREASNWAAAMHKLEHRAQPNHLPSALLRSANAHDLSGLGMSDPVHDSHILARGPSAG